jgi:ferredoxin
MKIRIDRERCMGSGSCQFHAPQTFDLDAECKAIVIDAEGDAAGSIRNAAESCPTRAIELAEGEGGS